MTSRAPNLGVRRALFAMLLAAAPWAHAGTFSVAPLSGDGDSGISAEAAFTHAINVNDTGNAKANGAVFTGSGTGTNPATNNYSTTGFAAGFTGFAAPVSGVTGGFMTNFLYNGRPSTVTLKNLRVGQEYETVFYNAAFGGAGGRIQTVTTDDGGSITFDQNNSPGSLLRYAFTAASNSITFSFAPQGDGTFHHYAFSNRMDRAQALFTDNFYAPSNPSTSNLNFNLASRQGGLVVAANGTVPWVATGNTQVGNNTGAIDGGNYLLTASSTGIAAIDHNFNNTDSAGGLSISFDIAPDIGAAGGGGWCAINLGMAAADKLAAVNGAQTHHGVLFRGSTGTLQAFDGSTVVSSTPEPVWSSTPVTTQLRHIELIITDSGDGNPFDGVGETRIEVYADGVQRSVFTKTGGGYEHNHINFQSSGIGGIDNLVIARLQTTPAPPVFLTQPQSQTLWRGDSLTLTASASSFPAATYQWYLDGVPINGATGLTYTVAAAGSGGAYTVVATNSRGSTTSNAATVNLITPTRAQRTWEEPGPSSRRTGLTISEIHYHPAARADGRNVEFVELYNSNPWVEDIAGWKLTGDIDYTFPAGAQVAAKGYVVVAKVPADVQIAYGVTGVFGGFTQNLSNEGSTLRLIKPSGGVVLEVSWSDREPWPVAPDGSGHSLVLARPSYGENSAQAWDASASVGGSPGAGETPPGDAQSHVAINEVLARSEVPLVDFVELRNDAPTAVDISGCTLSDNAAALGKYVIPPNTTLAPGGTISFTEAQLGFALSAEGETLYFTNAAGTRVLDAVRFGGSGANISLGRPNDQEAPFRALAAATPGAPNSAARMPDVLVSELFFDPISGDDLDEWLELYNPGISSIDVSGWQLADGVSFTIPAGTTIGAGARLVVAKNAARTRANHPSLNPALVVGDYSGTLANRGERLRLIRPETIGALTVPVEVDTIAYRKAGRWSRWAAGGGSSLEVTDLRANRSFPSTWADSDESSKSAWTDVTAAGVLDLGHTAVSGANRVQLFLMGEGETLVDNVTVTPSAGGNTVPNTGFESGLAGWILQGNHSRSSIASGAGFGGGAALQLRASDDGEPDGNRIYSALTTTLAANSTATISAKARWLRGHPELILRLKGGFLETLTSLNVPRNLGTPGQPNSQERANGAPAISDVLHRPLLPAGGVPIRVFARLNDPDGIGSAVIRWRAETNPNFTSAVMRDDGENGDIFPGDGVFTGTIPAQNAGTLIVFRVEAEDAATVRLKSVFPPEAPAHECLVRIGEPPQGGDFAAYRMWLTAANVSAWANRPKFGNEPVDATFIYGNARAVYGGGAWYAGSEASTPGYNSPIGNLSGYNVSLPPDDTVLDEDHFTLDFPVRDSTDQREQLMYWMAEQLRLPNLHRRYVHLFVNGLRRSTIFNDVQQPDQALLDEFFPDDNDGHLYKTNNWNEGADDANSTSGPVDNILRHYTSAGQRKLARYRWNWRPRAANSANEFGDLFTLIDAVNATSNYQLAVESVVDVENWMRTFAFHDLCSYWDSFGNPNHKNTYLYKPEAGKWVQITWDMDVGLGVFNDPTNAPLFPTTVDTKVDALQAFPPFRRIYWRTIQEAFGSFFSGSAVTPLLQRKYNALAANGIGLASPFAASGAYGLSVTQWIDQRRAFIQTQLNAVAANFSITSPASTTVTTPSATITGTAPVTAKTLTVNGVELPVVWNSVTAWRITLVPAAGSHPYVVRALDSNGVQVGTGTVLINFTGTNAWPALRINEWMASNGGSVTDPADGEADDWLELFNPTTEAVNLTNWRLSDSSATPTEFIFPPGYTITAQGRLVAWCDEETVQNAAPNSLHLPFKLSAGGETLTLTAPDGTVVDSVTFGQQVSDISQGRLQDGAAEIDFLATPSAGNVNSGALATPVAAATSTAPDNISITVNTTPGFSYQLQAKDDLTEALWVDLGAAVTATGGSLTFGDSSAGRSQRFYRVVRRP